MAQKRSIRRRKYAPQQGTPKNKVPKPLKIGVTAKTLFSGKDLRRPVKTKHISRIAQVRLQLLRKGKPTRLRKIYLEDLRLHRYRPLTIEMYLGFMLKFFAVVWKRPEDITDEDLRTFFHYVEVELGWSNSYLIGIFSAIKFFFDHTFPRRFKTLEIYRQPHPVTYPEVLSQEEVRTILSLATDVRYHAYLVLIYSCGLRAKEGLRVQVSDIDSKQGLLHVRDGKGGKTRIVPIPQNTLRILREMWLTHKHPQLLFPGYAKFNSATRIRSGTLNTPPCYHTMLNYFREIAAQAGIRRNIGLHTLRHSYATHLLEEGFSIRTVQEYLGHDSMGTTSKYLHLTKKMRREGAQTLENLMGDL